jgi:hypothetical protein
VAKSILVMVEKSDKDQAKLVEKYMKEVFELSNRPFEIKSKLWLILAIQYNEFSLANALVKEDFKKLGNIVLTNPDFVPRLQAVLVRERYCENPESLIVDSDPVDGALMIARGTVF